MIRLLTSAIRTGLVATAMVVTVPMITFAETTEGAVESGSVAVKPAAVKVRSKDESISAQANTPANTGIPDAVKVEVQEPL